MGAEYRCPAGLFCPAGTAVVPTNATHACPRGSFCPEAVPVPTPCAPGAHAPYPGYASCPVCPAGSFCVEGASDPTGVCAGGYYCPVGSESATMRPCPAGTQRNATGGVSEASCGVCPAGFHCPSGTATPSVCPRGSYCSPGSGLPTPCPHSTFGNSSGLRNVTECRACLPGYYCDSPGLQWPTGQCDPGFFCSEGSPTSQPSFPGPPTWLSSALLPAYGDECPRGGYCPLGSFEPQPCPVGTYLNSTRQSGPEDCLRCTPGHYCAETSSPGPSGKCSPGYYCTGGASSPTQFEAPNGTYTGNGDSAPIQCSPGTFNQETAQPACKPCTPGFYCPEPGMAAAVACPAGHYCPMNSTVPTPCRPGTFNPFTHGTNITACQPCLPGRYCLTSALTAVTGLCEAGFFCSGASQLPDPSPEATYGGPCTKGHFCVEGSHSPEACEAGTYNPAEAGRSRAGACLPCTSRRHCNGTGLSEPTGLCAAGFYCTERARTSEPTDGVTGQICPQGTYCPVGSLQATPCADGFYANETGLPLCKVCPAGHFCAGEATKQPSPCPVGRYCPAQTGANRPMCPVGTHNPVTHVARLEDCAACPAGRFCATPGLKHPTGNCTAGFFCPAGSSNALGGSPSGSPNARPCPAGTYCPAASPAQVACPAGTYQPAQQESRIDSCLLCPDGQYCEGSGLASPQGNCTGGYFCRRGVDSRTPSGGTSRRTLQQNNNTVTLVVGGAVCSPGTYCPSGSAAPIKCRPGTASPEHARATPCPTCPAGYYCETGADNFTSFPCPKGYYCPAGTPQADFRPCPPGTYNNETRQHSLAACVSCEPGTYCAGEANARPDGPCQSGFYCSGRSHTPAPPANVSYGGRCELGSFCPTGSSQPRPCDGGLYCASPDGLPDGPCHAGFFCEQGSPTPAPTGQTNQYGLIGDVCPPGHYCPNATVRPVPCPPGTSSNATGATNISACARCPAGSACPGSGTPLPVMPCPPGFFCPIGTAAPTLPCPRGHSCPTGSPSPVPCAAGSFQNLTGRPTCDVCPARGFCVLASALPSDCPRGHYCPANTSFATQFPCPQGTFLNRTASASRAECIQCSGGSFCGATGLPEPSGPCAAGFYCTVGAGVPRPSAGSGAGNLGYVCALSLDSVLRFPSSQTSTLLRSIAGPAAAARLASLAANATLLTNASAAGGVVVTGDACPPGHFCPAGSQSPVPCPPGTYTGEAANANSSQCKPCPAGLQCPSPAMVAPGPNCTRGFVCPTGTASPRIPCAPGHFCPGGDVDPIACPAGTFTNRSGAYACDACPARSFCVARTATPAPCPPGSFCPSATQQPREYLCPTGSFSNTSGLALASECEDCTPGRFCGAEGLAAPSGPCTQGHVCTGGSRVPSPASQPSSGRGSAAAGGHICPEGHYCPRGTSGAVPCPPGTRGPGTGGSNLSHCSPCTPGFTCPVAATVTPTVLCAAGFYCPGGDADSTVRCTPGHFCPGGDATPIACPAGTQSPSLGAASCSQCPAGGLCLGSTVVPLPCPAGSFCPVGTASAREHLCPNGTFSNSTGLLTASQCRPCTAGSFCGEVGLVAPSGPCAPGYFCTGGAITPRPANSSGTGGPCDPGFVCVGGSVTPRPRGQGGYTCPPGARCGPGTTRELGCPPGTYNPTGGLETCLACPAGRVCPGNNTFSQPCPAGRFCAGGDVSGSVCPAGTYGNTTGLTAAAECALCPAGRYCIDGVVTSPCAAGHVCYFGVGRPDPPASDMPRGQPCPPGNFCPNGTIVPQRCANGTFRGAPGGRSAADCGPCPLGFRCFPGDPTAYPCPLGHYCPVGTETPVACPAGTHNPILAQVDIDACVACPAGYECFRSGQGVLDAEVLCPPGNFCPNNTVSAKPCPGGTYRDIVGARSTADCFGCAGGEYCPPGSNSTIVCPESSYCPPLSAAPVDCPAGSRCPPATDSPLDCPPGSYCPRRTATPLACPALTYCPRNSSFPVSCPPGHRAAGDRSPAARESFAGMCEVCPPGSYTNNASMPECLRCTPGYVCTGGTSRARPTVLLRDGGYVCPRGTYCPAGTSVPELCPAGLHNPRNGSSSLGACLPCPAGGFSASAGTFECRPCSRSSTSPSGSTSCQCVGRNRVFQEADGQCICAPQFEYFDEQFVRRSEEDGTEDCQPIVYESCVSGTSRDTDGKCAFVNDASVCATSCPSGSGRYEVRTGICECSGIQPLDDVCNEACRSTQPVLRLVPDPTNPAAAPRITIDLSGTGNGADADSTLALTEVPGFTGSLSCDPGLRIGLPPGTSLQSSAGGTVQQLATDADSLCGLETVQMGATGFGGAYGAAEGVTSAAQAQASAAAAAAAASGARRLLGLSWDQDEDVLPASVTHNMTADEALDHGRRLAAAAAAAPRPPPDHPVVGSYLDARRRLRALQATASSTTPTVSQPIACIRRGDAMVWQIPSDGSSYPVYVKDSLLNTNKDFDFGAFRALAEKVRSSANVTVFGFTFRDPGTYVFASSADATQRMIVTVMEAGASCPTSGTFVPLTQSNLVLIGARQSQNIVTNANWALIVAVLVGFVATLLVSVGVMAYFQNRAWAGAEEGPVEAEQYKKSALAMDLAGLHQHGQVLTGSVRFDEGESAAGADGGEPAAGEAGAGKHARAGTDPRPASTKALAHHRRSGLTMDPAVFGSVAAALEAADRLGGARDDAGKKPTTLLALTGEGEENKPGTGPGAAGGRKWDVERWEADDIDPRAVLERLEDYLAVMLGGMSRQEAQGRGLRSAMGQELADVRRLLARSSFERDVAAAAAKDEGARRTAVARAVADELTARGLHDRRREEAETSLLDAIDALAECVEPGPDTCGDLVVDELRSGAVLAGGADGQGADDDAADDAETAVDPADMVPESFPARLSARLAAVTDAADRVQSVSEEEDRRRDGAVPLWQAAAQLGAFTDNPAVLESINALREAERQADAQTQRLEALAAPVRRAAPQALHVVSQTVGKFARHLRRAASLEAPADAAARASAEGSDPSEAAAAAERAQEDAEVRSTSCRRRFAVLVRELLRVLGAMSSALPRARERATALRLDADNSRAEFESHIRSLTEAFERLRDLGGAPEESLRALLDQLEKALAFEDEESGEESDDDSDDGSRADLVGDGGSGHEGSDEEASADGDGEGGRILGDEGREAIDEAARREAEREEDDMRRRLAEEEARQLADEESQRRRAEAAARERVAASGATDEERERLLGQHDRDQTALQEALEKERRRQKEELESSMAARREERLARRRRLAEEKAARDVEAARRKDAEGLAEDQDRKRKELEEQLQAEEEAERLRAAAAEEEEAAARGTGGGAAGVGLGAAASAASASGGQGGGGLGASGTASGAGAAPAEDTDEADAQEALKKVQRSAEDELVRLRDQHADDLQKLQEGLDVEKRRQREAARRRVEQRRRAREEELRRRQQKELDAAAGDDDAEDEARRRHAEEEEGLQRTLEAEEADEAQQTTNYLAKRDADVEEQRRRLQERLKAETTALQGRMDVERRKQHGELKARLAERRARREEEIARREQAAKELSALRRDEEAGVERAAAEALRREQEAAETGEKQLLKRTEEAAEAIVKETLSAEDELQRLRDGHDAERQRLEEATALERRRQEASARRRLRERDSRREALLRSRREALLAQAAAGSDPAKARAEAERQLTEEEATARAEAQAEEARESAAIEEKLREGEAASKARVQVLEQQARLDEELAELRGQERRAGTAAAVMSPKQRRLAQLESRQRRRRIARLQTLRDDLMRAMAALEGKNADAEVEARRRAEAQAEEEERVRATVQSMVGGLLKRTRSSLSVNQKKLQEVARKEAEELERRQEAERIAARDEEERLAAEEAGKRAAEEDRGRKEQMAAKRRELEARIAGANESNEGEAERLRARFDEELGAFESSLDEEKQRQQAKLDKQLAARKERQARMLARKQAKEQEEAASRADERRREAEAKEAKERERLALTEVLGTAEDGAGGSGAAAAGGAGGLGDHRSEAIEVVMQDRHAKETSEMIARHYSERTKAVRTVMEQLFEERRAQEAEARAEAEASGEDPEAAAAAVHESFASRMEEAKEEALEEVESRHGQEALRQRKRQLAEVAEMFHELAPDDVLRRHEAEEAAKEAEETQRVQGQMEQERRERMAAIRKEREEFERRMHDENEEELRRLEQDHEAQLAQEKERQEKALAVRRDRMERELEEAKKAQLAETSTMDDEARAELLRRFEGDRMALEARLETLRAADSEKLRRRLDERRRRRRAVTEARQAEERRVQEEASAKEEHAVKKQHRAMTRTLTSSGSFAGKSWGALKGVVGSGVFSKPGKAAAPAAGAGLGALGHVPTGAPSALVPAKTRRGGGGLGLGGGRAGSVAPRSVAGRSRRSGTGGGIGRIGLPPDLTKRLETIEAMAAQIIAKAASRAAGRQQPAATGVLASALGGNPPADLSVTGSPQQPQQPGADSAASAAAAVATSASLSTTDPSANAADELELEDDASLGEGTSALLRLRAARRALATMNADGGPAVHLALASLMPGRAPAGSMMAGGDLLLLRDGVLRPEGMRADQVAVTDGGAPAIVVHQRALAPGRGIIMLVAHAAAVMRAGGADSRRQAEPAVLGRLQDNLNAVVMPVLEAEARREMDGGADPGTAAQLAGEASGRAGFSTASISARLEQYRAAAARGVRGTGAASAASSRVASRPGRDTA